MDRQGFRNVVLASVVAAVVVLSGIWWYKEYRSASSQGPISQSEERKQSTSTPPMMSPSEGTDVVSSTFISTSGKVYTYTNVTYGVSVSYPATEPFGTEADANELGDFESGNFAVPQGAVLLTQIGVSQDLYPTSNFGGGLFALLVNPMIGSTSSCNRYAELDPTMQHPFISFQTIDGITYSETTLRDDSMTIAADLFEFHTFQNARCYELDLEVDQPQPVYGNPAVSIPTSQLENDLIGVFIAHVKFTRPQ